jgi:hypothetical protein
MTYSYKPRRGKRTKKKFDFVGRQLRQRKAGKDLKREERWRETEEEVLD